MKQTKHLCLYNQQLISINQKFLKNKYIKYKFTPFFIPSVKTKSFQFSSNQIFVEYKSIENKLFMFENFFFNEKGRKGCLFQ